MEKLGSPLSAGPSDNGIPPVLVIVTAVCCTGLPTRLSPKSNDVLLNVTVVVGGGTALIEPIFAGPQPTSNIRKDSAPQRPQKLVIIIVFSPPKIGIAQFLVNLSSTINFSQIYHDQVTLVFINHENV
jgi:hypothetical protein